MREAAKGPLRFGGAPSFDLVGMAGAGFEPADPGYGPGMYANASPAIFTSRQNGAWSSQNVPKYAN